MRVKINIWTIFGLATLLYLVFLFLSRKRKTNIFRNIEKLSKVSEKIEDIDEKVGMKYIMAKIFRDKLHDYEKACQKFSEIIDQYPENVLTDAVMFELGETYYQMGNMEVASKYFQNVVSTYPESVSARKASERLKTITVKGE